MQDVARLAQVSLITVSRAINTPERVAPATLAAVRAAIRTSGYVHNLAASALASKHSRVIGAIVPTIDNSIFAETVRGLSETLAASGYQLLLGQSSYDLQAEEALVLAFLGRRVDGLVLTGGIHTKLVRKAVLQSGAPVVETWDLPKRPLGMVAGFSNFAAGKAVGQFLTQAGKTSLFFAGGPDERSAQRLAGLREAISSEPHVSLRVETLAAGESFHGGRSVIARLAQAGPLPEAIFFGNDALAAGALIECQQRQIAVPGQLAIVGFADLAIARVMEPPITTVRVPTHRMGEVAAQMLLARLQGLEPAPPVRDLGFELIRRVSA